jgi:hypothetical protein
MSRESVIVEFSAADWQRGPIPGDDSRDGIFVS